MIVFLILVQDQLGTVEFIQRKDNKEYNVFSTSPSHEYGRLVFQIGTSQSTNALQAAQVVYVNHRELCKF